MISTFFLIIATSFTFGESIEVENPNQMINVLLENQNFCLKKIKDNKAYVKPKNVYPTNDGIFLRVNQFHLVKLPSVHSDDEGCYVPLKPFP